MFAMGALLALSALVPEPENLDSKTLEHLRTEKPALLWIAERFRPQSIVESPFFLLLPSFLLVGISASLVERMRQLRRANAQERALPVHRFRLRRELEVVGSPDALLRRVIEAARRDGYAMTEVEPSVFEGLRGRAGFFGSLAFHVGLLAVLAGVVASGLTRFSGEIVVTERFSTPFSISSMFNVSGANRFEEIPGEELSIRDFAAEYSDRGTPVDFSVLLSVRRDGAPVSEEQVRVNQAFRWRSVDIMLNRYGFAPEIVATDPSGARRLDGVGVLRLLPPGQEDSLRMEDGSRLRVRLFPDFDLRNGSPVSRSLAPVRPRLYFEWTDPVGRSVARGEVEKGGSAASRGYRVDFPALLYWGSFVVARDWGFWFFVVGSVLGTLGLAIRMIFPDQTLRLEWSIGDNGIHVRLDAGARFFPALHEAQIDRLMSKIREG